MSADEKKPLTRPRIYLFRMGVFLVIAGFAAFILYRPIWIAFLANPILNGLIVVLMLVGVLLALSQVTRLFRETRWVNGLELAEATRRAERTGEASNERGPAERPPVERAWRGRPPVLLAPIAQTLGPQGSLAIPVTTMRTLLDTIGARLDESREIVRYIAGLLILLGLLGTFWGLIETVGAVGRNIAALRTGGDAAVMFDELKTSLAAPLTGIGIAFSSSLFGLAGSLVVGFLDLQAGQAQNRFFTELEDYLTAHAVEAPVAAEPTLRAPSMPSAVNEGGGGRAATQAMANLAEGIQGLVQHMRAEQQMIRDWVEAQAAREKELKQVLERLTRERA